SDVCSSDLSKQLRSLPSAAGRPLWLLRDRVSAPTRSSRGTSPLRTLSIRSPLRAVAGSVSPLLPHSHRPSTLHPRALSRLCRHSAGCRPLPAAHEVAPRGCNRVFAPPPQAC